MKKGTAPGGARVWLIHQAGVVRDLYVEAIENAGFVTEIADRAAAVVHQIESREPPTVIVLELLPEPATTWLFIERARQHQPNTPIIVLTSLVRPDGANRQRARRLACAAFIAKPCGLDVLVNAIVRVIRGDRGLEIVTGE